MLQVVSFVRLLHHLVKELEHQQGKQSIMKWLHTQCDHNGSPTPRVFPIQTLITMILQKRSLGICMP